MPALILKQKPIGGNRAAVAAANYSGIKRIRKSKTLGTDSLHPRAWATANYASGTTLDPRMTWSRVSRGTPRTTLVAAMSSIRRVALKSSLV